MSVYHYSAKTIKGNPISLEEYKGKVLLIVNTASNCKFTPQYEDLQKLYLKYKDQGFEILGFPCNQFMEQEPGDNSEILSFCTLNYGVTFPLFSKIEVNGPDAHPLYKYLKENAPFKGFDLDNPQDKLLNMLLNEKFPEFNQGDEIRWNFTKFIVDKNGNVFDRFESSVEPSELEPYIKRMLK